jgi:hypothetical protein
MKTSVDEFASILERLAEKVQELEFRLSALEHRAQGANALMRPKTSTAAAGAHPVEQTSLAPAGVMPAVGKMFLGIAGAYVLRAVAESGLLPRLAVVAVALAYAGMWLVWASRARSGARFAGTAYAVTAALILSPMLWEVTLRFKVLPGAATAGVLAAFAVLASALAWRRKLTSMVWVTTFSAVAMALVLLVATRNPAPFAIALLVMALTTEAAGCRDRWLSLRPVVAVAGDLALFVLISVYTRPDGPPPEYQPMASGLLLALLSAWLAVYAAVAVFRATVGRSEVSFFEIGQTLVAFLLAAVDILRIGHGRAALGTLCLLAAAGCYRAALLRFARIPRPRNFHVFAAWAAALLLTGSFLCFPPVVLVIELSVAALAAALASARWPGATLGFHAAAYLAAAGFVSGLLNYAGRALAGALPPAPAWPVWTAAFSAVLCYGIVWRAAPELGSPSLRDHWKLRLPWFLVAAVTVGALAALSVVAIAWLAPGGATVSAARLSVIRTFVIAMAALALAWGSQRGKRIELAWLAYTTIALCTVKLLLEDLRYGSAGSVALSLFFYGMVWVLIPRLLRPSPR